MDYVIAVRSKYLQMMVAHSSMDRNLDKVTRHFERFNADVQRLGVVFKEVTHYKYRGGRVFEPVDTMPEAAGKYISEEEKEVDEVGRQLEQLPKSLLQFTQTLRSFYAKNQVSGEEAATKSFLEVRDDVMRKALVYRDHVLPMKQKVVRSIAFFADTFDSLEFDDWIENLEDIIKELEEAHTLCGMLEKMHNNMIKDLKKNKDRAKMSIEQLQKLRDNYEHQRNELDHRIFEAKQEFHRNVDEGARWTEQAEKDKWWGNALAPFTLGITYFLYNKGANDAIKEAQTKAAKANEVLEMSGLALATSLALAENSNITSRAAALTLTHIIPPLEQFLDGLEACSKFLCITLKKLRAMNETGAMAIAKDVRKDYYTMMTNKSSRLSSHCEMFLARSDLIEVNLGDLPDSAITKNYVDLWLDQVNRDFAATHNNKKTITNKNQTQGH